MKKLLIIFIILLNVVACAKRPYILKQQHEMLYCDKQVTPACGYPYNRDIAG